MRHTFERSLLALTALTIGCSAGGTGATDVVRSNNYNDLSTLFVEWRNTQAPARAAGVPDYTTAAMATQNTQLLGMQARLAAIDPSGWPVPQQVDYHLVRAEMNGLDFDQRVLRPWQNNPGFYVTFFNSESDQPLREGHFAVGSIEAWEHSLPYSTSAVAQLDSGLRAIPGLLQQARTNLTGNQKDLWIYGTQAIKSQSAALKAFGDKLPPEYTLLKSTTDRAIAATDSLASWLDVQAPMKTDSSGVGIENYNWYLRNVMLLPYSWDQVVMLMERELARSWSNLAFEEKRNAHLPVQLPIADSAQFTQRTSAEISRYMAFLRDREILTVKEYMEPSLRQHVSGYRAGPREFFSEVDYRDPEVMRTHYYHWFDKAWMVFDPPSSSIRKFPSLYNIFITRTEGLATAWEELMLQAGMFDHNPRSRELVYILLAQRAARALGDLHMHANHWDIEQAAVNTSSHTPRGWLPLEGRTVRNEQHLYLRQPGYGISYVIGKIELDRLIMERKRQLGDAFVMRDFMDTLNASGFIPASLLRWEMTGVLPDDVKAILQ